LEGEQHSKSMPEQTAVTNNFSRFKILLLSLSIGLGLALAICGSALGPDDISYLDMGDYFFAGDWKAILNGLWSPLFPFVQGLTRWLFKPTIEWEITLVQLTNFFIFVSTILAFRFFWGEVFRLYRSLSQKEPLAPLATFSENEFWAFGYAIFLLMHLDSVTSTTPDMLLSTTVYISAGLIVRIRLCGPTLRRFSLLGLILGVGFLAKAVMLPLAGAFLAAAVFPNLRHRFLVFYALAASVAFTGVVSPYVFQLSREKGHFTTGEAAMLNYAWHVNGAPFAHWQGEIANLGKPDHPTRKIFSSPSIYEFGTPVRGTYPPWYDPSYWNGGLRARFNLGDQLRAIARNVNQYLGTFWSQNALIACVLVLVALRQDIRSVVHDFLSVWYLWIPAVAAFGLYGLVWVENRYLPQFFVLFWAGALTLVRLPRRNVSQRFIRAVTIVAVFVMTVRIGVDLVEGCKYGHRAASLQMAIVEGLSAQGVRPGEKVALIGASLGDGWPKLARVFVVAEIPLEERETFWSVDIVKRKEICQVLAKTGAQVVIAEEVPNWAQTAGLERAGSTPVYIYRLNP
jgi:hypothetical protein